MNLLPRPYYRYSVFHAHHRQASDEMQPLVQLDVIMENITSLSSAEERVAEVHIGWNFQVL